MDIVEKLRRITEPLDTAPGVMIHPVAVEAAKEIESLRRRLQDGSPVVEGTIQQMAMEIAALKKERDGLVEALKIAKIGMCSVGVPHAGERKVLQDAVDAVRSALAKLGADKEEV